MPKMELAAGAVGVSRRRSDRVDADPGQVSQPLVAAVLGVVVLGETLDTGRAGAVALVVAVVVMTAATIALAREDAEATRRRVAHKRRRLLQSR